jgi:hypothetical protein
MHLSSVGAQDIRVTWQRLDGKYSRSQDIHTSIDDGHGGAAEELTTRSAKLNLLRNQVSQKPSEVTGDLFSGPALKYRSVSCR